jgi:hypothetical protein
MKRPQSKDWGLFFSASLGSSHPRAGAPSLLAENPRANAQGFLAENRL